MPVVLFIVTLPLLISLGHDAYLYYLFYTGTEPTFNFPALGWIWATYHKESLNTVAVFINENLSEETWAFIKTHILGQKSSILGVGFAALFYVPFVVIKLLKPKKSANDRLMGMHKNKKKTRYKRR